MQAPVRAGFRPSGTSAVALLGPLFSCLYQRARDFGKKKLARIAALVCGYEVLLLTYNKRALGAP